MAHGAHGASPWPTVRQRGRDDRRSVAQRWWRDDHDVWVAIDPGSIVNPAIIEAQVNSAVALGLSSTLLEEVVYVDGVPQARNFDGYPILPPDRMPRVHVRIVESGAPMGGIGEPRPAGCAACGGQRGFGAQPVSASAAYRSRNTK